MPAIRMEEPRSGLAATATLLDGQAPANARFLWSLLETAREVAAIHAMWTGPEISMPLPAAWTGADMRAQGLPLENATVMPQPGDCVLTFLPARLWGGGEMPVFDLGLFYGPHSRLFFPIGWQPGSVVARVAAEAVPETAEACAAIRRSGTCTVRLSRAA